MRIAAVTLLIVAAACSKKESEAPKAPDTAPTPVPTASGNQFITGGSGVRLRATAAADGAEVVKLPVGTLLSQVDTSADAGWAHVSTKDGQQGFISATVIRPLDKAHPEQTYLTLANERNAKEDLPFPERADLYWALSHALEMTQDHAAKAKLELARIIALKKALDGGVQLEGEAAKQYKGFAKQLGETLVVFSEPAGQFLPETQRLWETADAYKDVPDGELIAWEAAQTSLPGECEGFFGCYVSITNVMDGNYLKRYPKGPHAAEALAAYVEMKAPTDKADYADWDGESMQDINDSLKETDAILAACDPDAAKAAKATVAQDRKTIAKMTKAGR
jgi:hypothetical protein